MVAAARRRPSPAEAARPAAPGEELVRTKLGAPVPRPGSVERTELLELLQAAPSARLVLVSAPAGFGKTTLLAHWIASQAIDAGWLSLDLADNDPARFLRYLAAAALPVVGSAGTRLETLLASPQISADAVLAAVVDALAELPGHASLVLDDYHLVDAPAVHAFVGSLVDRLPPNARLAIATRADPPLPLARWRARAELTEVRADRLRFSATEAGAFLNGTMGLTLGDAQVAALAERTEGWAAGLQLAGLSLQGRRDADAFIGAFAGSHRFVLDYLVEEVLGREQPKVQWFLLRTAVLERLTAPLCDAVTEGSGAQGLLERLDRRNLFLVPLDEERRWYRYHHLFADLLRAQLRLRSPEEEPALHLRAAAWLDAHGFADDAIRHALAAGDTAGAADLVERHWLATEHAGELDTALRWLDALPESIVRARPQLSAAYAWALALKGTSDGVEERLADAEAALAGPPPAEQSTEAAAIRRTIPAQVALLRTILARMGGDIPSAIRHAERALALVPPALPPALDALLRGDAWSLLGHAHRAAGDEAAAVRAYREALPLLRSGGNAIGVGNTVYHLACADARAGRAQEARCACEEALREATAAGLGGSPSSALLHAGLAEALLATGETDDARRHAERAVELARLGCYSEGLRCGQAVLDRLTMRPRTAPARTADGLVEPLTEREREVLGLLAEGRSNREIAQALVVAVGTVKFHVHSLQGKLGTGSRLQAVARARQLGLVH